MANSEPVVLPSNQSAIPIKGDVAHDDPAGGVPIETGAKYEKSATTPSGGTAGSTSAVSADGDFSRGKCDRDGRRLVNAGANEHWSAKSNTTLAQTNVTLKAAPGANKRIVVTYCHGTTESTRWFYRLKENATTPAEITASFVAPTNVMGSIGFGAEGLRLTANQALLFSTVITGAGTLSITIGGYIENIL